jgi:hypothetical protein
MPTTPKSSLFCYLTEDSRQFYSNGIPVPGVEKMFISTVVENRKVKRKSNNFRSQLLLSLNRPLLKTKALIRSGASIKKKKPIKGENSET